MDSFSEVRRVRKQMSDSAGHDIRALIASINSRWPNEAADTIDPGTKAEKCDATEPPKAPSGNGESSPASR